MLLTERLMLRPFWDDDFARFAEINADPQVMAHFPATLSRAESDALIARIMVRLARDDFGLWAVEAPGVAPLIGMVGLQRVGAELPCAPAVELVWRLGRPYWGRGYALEAAKAAIADAVMRCDLHDFVAFTAVDNRRSRAVMERLGMTRDASEDFDHPALPEGHRLRRHVLYRLHMPAAGVTG